MSLKKESYKKIKSLISSFKNDQPSKKDKTVKKFFAELFIKTL
jgi:hypothetical protein